MHNKQGKRETIKKQMTNIPHPLGTIPQTNTQANKYIHTKNQTQQTKKQTNKQTGHTYVPLWGFSTGSCTPSAGPTVHGWPAYENWRLPLCYGSGGGWVDTKVATEMM